MVTKSPTPVALPSGATLTIIAGRQCTAIPRADTSFLNALLGSSTIPVPISTTAPSVITTAPPAATTSAASASAAPPAPPQVVTTSTIAPLPAAVVPQPVASPQATTSSNTPPIQAAPAPEAIPSTSILSSPSPSPSSIAPPTTSSSDLPTTSSSDLPTTLSSASQSTLSTSLSSLASSSPVEISQASPTTQQVAPASIIETVAAKTTSSTSSTLAIAQSELSPLVTSTNDGTFPGTTATATASSSSTALASSTSAATAQLTTATATPSGSKAVVAGAVLGGLAFIGLLSLLLWYLRRRRRRRESFLTPLGSAPSEFSGSSILASNNREESGALEKFFNGVGSSFAKLKDRVQGGRKNSVNLNRGNSQFLERVPQHSRQNSAVSAGRRLNVKERFTEWYERMKAERGFNLRVKYGKKKEPIDPFSAAREKQAAAGSVAFDTTSPNFAQLLAMEERELQLEAEKRRQSLAKGLNLGSLGLENPFADPINPFNDPANVVAAPKPIQPPDGAGYHARNQSIAPTVASRYPSTYAPDRDSYGYRDTYMSSATNNGRKTKGRSDPFDLEKLQLQARPPPIPGPGAPTDSLYYNGYNNAGNQDLKPRIVSEVSEISRTGTYSSKYPSGLSDWGDPGPDLGPGSSLPSIAPLNISRHDSDALGWLQRNGTTGSGKSVGKAL